MRAPIRAAVLAFGIIAVSLPANAEDAGEVRIAPARAQVDATLAQMRATSLRVRDELRITRKRGTKAQITCVDEALSRSDVALRRAREVGEELLAARARDDGTAADASLRRLSELKETQRLAAASAMSCAPRAVPLVSSTTTVKLSVDRNIAPAP